MATATRMVTYADQETALAGFLTWDEATPQPQPGLLLVHGEATSTITPRARHGGTPRSAMRSWRVTCSEAA